MVFSFERKVGETVKKINIVKENEDFSKIINHGNCVKDKNLVIYYQDNELSRTRFGISVGTKVGKAHIRNKLKRQMRNIVDNFKFSYSNSKDYIIIIRKNCLDITYQEIEKSYQYLFQKINRKERRLYEETKQ